MNGLSRPAWWAIFVLALLPLEASAAGADASAAKLPDIASRTLPGIEVANARRLTLKFSDYTQLNGDYRVSPDNTVSIPVLGRFDVEGLTILALEEAVANKASAITGRRTFVTVEIAEYRPVFVMGQVRNQGEISWRPDMTVLQLVATAGGLQSPNASGSGSDVLQLKRLVDDQKRNIASLARVRAELDRSPIEVPKQLIALAGEAEARALIENQKRLMSSHEVTTKNQLTLLDESKTLASDELEALKMQRTKIAENLQLLRERSNQIQQLYAKGLTVADRTIDDRLKITDLEEKEANLAVAIVRIQSAMAGYKREATNLVNLQRASLLAEAQTLDRAVTQADFELQGASVDLRQSTSAVAGSAGSYRYRITRGGPDEKPIEGSGTTKLLPGDVVNVTFESQVGN
jgi:exopolysaccharide production protein ExoF